MRDASSVTRGEMIASAIFWTVGITSAVTAGAWFGHYVMPWLVSVAVSSMLIVGLCTLALIPPAEVDR